TPGSDAASFRQGNTTVTEQSGMGSQVNPPVARRYELSVTNQ
ncbi:MAG: hypothetical protein QOE41_109, partial [Mycobacterium sp.]|nr:hypothetical protein [Mycobacterium sp.]